MKKELIVARFKEDLSWIKAVDKSVDSIIVYNKGPENFKSSDPRVKVIKLKNAGREAQTYIHHFAKNRDGLADTTLTCQGDPFEHSPYFLLRLQEDYEGVTSTSRRYMEKWPPVEVTMHDKVERPGSGRFETRYGDMKYFGHRDRKTTRLWFENIWSIVFEDPCPEKYYYGYSAMWSIPKENILLRSQNFWDFFNKILSEQFSTEAYTASIDAWGFEALWNAIFDPKYTTRL